MESCLVAAAIWILHWAETFPAAEAVATAQRWLRDAAIAELAGVVTSVRTLVAGKDGEVDRVLWELSLLRVSKSNPFAGAEQWAAFAYTGA